MTELINVYETRHVEQVVFNLQLLFHNRRHYDMSNIILN